MRIKVSLVLLPSKCRHADFWWHTAGVVDIVVSVTLQKSVKIYLTHNARLWIWYSAPPYLTILKENWRHIKAIQGDIWKWRSYQLHHCWENVHCGTKLYEVIPGYCLYIQTCSTCTSVVFPGCIFPGQWAIPGTLWPPSHVVPLPHRRSPALPPRILLVNEGLHNNL